MKNAATPVASALVSQCHAQDTRNPSSTSRPIWVVSPSRPLADEKYLLKGSAAHSFPSPRPLRNSCYLLCEQRDPTNRHAISCAAATTKTARQYCPSLSPSLSRSRFNETLKMRGFGPMALYRRKPHPEVSFFLPRRNRSTYGTLSRGAAGRLHHEHSRPRNNYETL